jgi:hypothetical protein
MDSRGIFSSCFTAKYTRGTSGWGEKFSRDIHIRHRICDRSDDARLTRTSAPGDYHAWGLTPSKSSRCLDDTIL